MEQEIYIYGAAVQGIQDFIFRTNELKDIVGASELVEHICTTLFEDEFKQGGDPIVMAAGNIKCIYKSREECEKTVMYLPKRVMEAAPGITLSQAVVKTTKTELQNNFKLLMNHLEEKLHTQRNKSTKSMTVGFMATERSRKTGLPATTIEKGEYLDEATVRKRELSVEGRSTIKLCEKSFGQKELSAHNIALNIGDLTGENNDWIAVIHADGNGLGEVVQRMSTNPENLRSFSEKLDQSTIQAAKAAFRDVYTASEYMQKSTRFPFRPVVLGGDDMTIICKASLAVPYTKAYLKHFEDATERNLGSGNGLTACAGIAFIKSSYPFHYGYELAEALCSQAKKVSKSPEVNRGASAAPSSLMFYKIQGSFIESYDHLIEKEKTPAEGHQLTAGPYFLKETDDYWTIDQLISITSELSSVNGNTAKSAIRKWMTSMHQSTEMAQQARKRSLDILMGAPKEAFEKATEPQQRTGSLTLFYPAADILDLHTIKNQTTKQV